MRSLVCLPIAVALVLLLSGTAPARTAIYDIQYTTDPSGSSPMQGQSVTISGIVTAIFVSGYVVAEEEGHWHAIYVYSTRDGPKVGDEVEVSGTVLESGGMTRIASVTHYARLSQGNVLNPLPVNAAGSASESLESVLVTLSDIEVTALDPSGGWTISDGTGSLQCDDLNDYAYFPGIGDALESLTGVLFFAGGVFKVEPRTTADIRGEVIPAYALLGTVVTMEEGLSVLQDAYVIIRGDRIVAIQQAEPPGLPIIDCGGLIFPGLVDAHNHAVWNVLDLIPFGQTFNDRSEWRATPLYAEFQTQYYAIRNYGGSDAQTSNAYKLAEVRALCAGTTMIQSTNCNGATYDYFAHQGIGIGNAERFPSRVYDSVFPLDESQMFWTQKRGEYWERFVIHLSEGINAGALQEFYTWRDWGMLDGRTTILHGVPYGPSEWAEMAAVGASLVWAPSSNWHLYAASPNIPQALAAGVNVAIAPDWTESGCRDMLAEMKYGYELNVSLWGGILTAEDFALFATRNAALAMGLHERVGKLAPGFQADCMVIPGDPQSPYDALLDADPADVRLTVVSGRPMYGDQELMTQFPFLGSMEEIEICGREKMLAVQVGAFAIPGSDKAMSLVISELEEAYSHALPRVCAFLGPYYCSTAGADGLADVDGPSLSVWPNPSRGSATFKLSGLGGGSARLSIHDGRGGIVRALLEGTGGAVDRLAVWDGRDEAGRRVASGVYFVRLDGGAQAAGVKIQLIR